MLKKTFLILSITIFCFSMISCGKSASEKAYDKAMDDAGKMMEKATRDAERAMEKATKDAERMMKDLGY